MHPRLLAVALAALALCSTEGTAQKRLTTLFATNNGRSAGATAFFDINVTSPTGIAITSLEINTSEVIPFEIDVYTCPTTYVGNDMNPGAWKFQRLGRGLGMNSDVPSIVTFAPPFRLAPGSHGIALHHRTAYLKYTNGTGSNQTYSNADLTITLGMATSTLFSGTVFNPRVWNGTIVYDVTPTPPSFVTWGPACAGSNGTPAMNVAANSAPKLGSGLQLAYTNLPAAPGVVTLIVGASRTAYGPLALPFALGSINMTGCSLYTSIDFTVPGVNTGGGAGLASLSIPASTALLGGEVFLQTFVPDAQASGFPARLTNAAQAVLGL